jgi:hypothetical protein
MLMQDFIISNRGRTIDELTHGSNQPKGSQAIKRDSKKRIKKKRIEKRISEHRQGRGIYNTSFLN